MPKTRTVSANRIFQLFQLGLFGFYGFIERLPRCGNVFRPLFFGRPFVRPDAFSHPLPSHWPRRRQRLRPRPGNGKRQPEGIRQDHT